MNISYIVITVCLNCRDKLENTGKAIEKLKSKNNITWLVIDGGSSDGTIEWLASAYNEALVGYYVSEHDDGLYFAMNKAIDALPVNDAFVIFINAGDILLRLPDETATADSDVILAPVLIEDVANRTTYRLSPSFRPRPNSLDVFFPKIHHQGFFCRSRLLKNFKYNVKLRIRADLQLMLEIITNSGRVSKIRDVCTVVPNDGVSSRISFSSAREFYLVSKSLNTEPWLRFGLLYLRLAITCFKIVLREKKVAKLRKMKFKFLEKLR